MQNFSLSAVQHWEGGINLCGRCDSGNSACIETLMFLRQFLFWGFLYASWMPRSMIPAQDTNNDKLSECGKNSGMINVNVLSTYIQKTGPVRLLNQCALFLFFEVIFITISQAIAHPTMRTTYVPTLKYQKEAIFIALMLKINDEHFLYTLAEYSTQTIKINNCIVDKHNIDQDNCIFLFCIVKAVNCPL